MRVCALLARRIEASAMARLFRQFTCCGALFSSVLPTFYPNRAPTALRHQGSLQTLHFLLDAEEVLSRPEVAEPLARLGPELRRLQDLYLAETPLTTNAVRGLLLLLLLLLLPLLAQRCCCWCLFVFTCVTPVHPAWVADSAPSRLRSFFGLG